MAQQALQRVKGRVQQLFDKNLSDLVRGIRNNKDDESRYIAQCLEEIKQELRHANLAVKSNAVAKLTYLQMLGYDISWATFNIIEVMNSTRFSEKRLGYLAASITFRPDTDMLMLTTNMIRKDLNSVHQYESGIALSSLSCFISHDLSRDLNDDVIAMLSSSRPYIRKKAVLLLYKIFLKYPEALRASFPKLREKLDDPDPGVQSAAVNVICELARKNPKNYLGLAPTFFKLMTNSANNWMLIKIIKLFAALTPLEPRLGKKLIEPLTNLIHSTSAMSLLYECINTVIAVLISISSGMPNHSAAVQLCVQKLRILIEDSDQNLKYLGLLAMSKILRTHPKSVQNHKDLILQCLDDSDESIRLRALDLLYGMVNKKNLVEITQKLLTHLDKAEGTMYRDELISKVISICSQNDYQYVTNFEWYISVLVELSRIRGSSHHGQLISSQLMDVAIRVESVRAFTVTQMALLIDNAHLLLASSSNNAENTAIEALYAAAYICGEFGMLLSDPSGTLLAMLKVKTTYGRVQAVFIHNALKLLVNMAASQDNATKILDEDLVQRVIEAMSELSMSFDLEVQERASTTLQLLQCLDQLSVNELEMLFKGELNPVAPKAQKRVPVPEGLDLDQWINEPIAELSDDENSEDNSAEDEHDNIFVSRAKSSPLGYNNDSDRNDGEHRSKRDGKRKKHKKKKRKDGSGDSEHLSKEELERRKAARIQAQMSNPNYLKDTTKSSTKSNSHDNEEEGQNVEVQPIDMDVPLYIPGLVSSEQYLSIGAKEAKKEKKKGKKKQEEEPKKFFVNKSVEMPPDGLDNVSDNDNDNDLPEDDPHRALGQISLDDLDYKKPFKAKSESVREVVQTEDASKKKKKKKKEDKEKKKDEDSSKKKKKSKKSKHQDEHKDEKDVPDPSQNVDFWLNASH